MAKHQTAIPAQDEGGRACKNGHRGCCWLLHGRDVQVLPGRNYRKVCASFTFGVGVFGRWKLFHPFNSRCCLLLIVMIMIMISTDKLGRPLYFDRVGEVDVDGMLTLTTQEKLLRNHIAYNESLLVDM